VSFPYILLAFEASPFGAPFAGNSDIGGHSPAQGYIYTIFGLEASLAGLPGQAIQSSLPGPDGRVQARSPLANEDHCPHASTRHTLPIVLCARQANLVPRYQAWKLTLGHVIYSLEQSVSGFERSRFFALPLVFSKPARIMRLLEHNSAGDLSLTKDFVGDDIPEYAMLSHTWGADTEEVTFKDLMDGTGKGKPGYKKIYFCGEQARRDGLQYFWVDTCCM
jgi:hypothetical protein